ncbi:PIN domain-like protein [Lipomyces oligophaga]|uniref:PIN domain-like protein n=1 Tax=Lipomyces oligophaga TaxID=45792 RepID=UPI0034CF8FC3
MGISGLLPLLKSIHKPCHISEFAGQVVAVDAYVWLHRGIISCATDLALGRPTSRYVDYAMRRVKLLQGYGVKPYMVFDGGNLPSKRGVEVDRASKRNTAKEIAMRYYQSGDREKANEFFLKSIDVTPLMALNLIKALEIANVPFIVAPYEADAQIAYLDKIGAVTAVISEDSDLLVFGVKCLLTKFSDYGDCIAVYRSRLKECLDIDFSSFSDTMFRHMVILSGCDYTPGLRNIGLKRAHQLLKQYRTTDRAMQNLGIKGVTVPLGFRDDFVRADKTFLHQRVFCPMKNDIVMWNEPSGTLSDEINYHIGS